jgi:hypothetical protein
MPMPIRLNANEPREGREDERGIEEKRVREREETSW